MKIKVGEYIRTKNGVIAKLEYIHNKDKVCWFNKVIYSRYGEEIDFLTTEELPKYVISHSKNIKDLVQKGDYINGLRVEKNKYGELYVSYVYYGGDIGNQYEVYTEWIDYLKNENICSVATKEQFESMEYRL